MQTIDQRIESLAARIEPIDPPFAHRLRARLGQPDSAFMGGFEQWMAAMERMAVVIERQHLTALTGRSGEPITLEIKTLHLSSHYPEISGRGTLPAWLLTRIDSAAIELGRLAAEKGFTWQELNSFAPHAMRALQVRHSEMMGTAARLAREIEYMLKGRNMGSPEVAEAFASDLSKMLVDTLGAAPGFTILDLVPEVYLRVGTESERGAVRAPGSLEGVESFVERGSAGRPGPMAQAEPMLGSLGCDLHREVRGVSQHGEDKAAARERRVVRNQVMAARAREKIERTRGYALF